MTKNFNQMKTIIKLPLFLFSVLLFISSCGSEPAKEKDKAPESTPPNADKVETSYTIDTEKSVVNWKGEILGGLKSHTGTLKFKAGTITSDGTGIKEGGLTVDMTSMATTDENYDADHTAEGLIGHLSTGDFFEVAKFPVASLIFKGGDKCTLSIRDKTHMETFSDFKMEKKGGETVFTAKLKFDRQKYGVTFTGAKDTPVSDDIELDVMLVAK